MSYVMEAPDEAVRLLAQEQADPIRPRLEWAGLRSGMRALDAGCGPGAITCAMAELVTEAGHVTGLDASAERIAMARTVAQEHRNIRLLEADICSTGLPSGHFDFTWSQYVFEYLPRPEVALAELVRVTRPGGTVAVADIDGMGFWNWPFPATLESRLQALLAALARTGFDLHVGRKMFHLFRQAGLANIDVRLAHYYMACGRAEPRLLRDWEIRLATLEKVGAEALGGREAYQLFCREFLTFLADDGSFKYAVVLTTRGTKIDRGRSPS